MTQLYVVTAFLVAITLGAGAGAYTMQLFATTQMTCPASTDRWSSSLLRTQPIPNQFKSY